MFALILILDSRIGDGDALPTKPKTWVLDPVAAYHTTESPINAFYSSCLQTLSPGWDFGTPSEPGVYAREWRDFVPLFGHLNQEFSGIRPDSDGALGVTIKEHGRGQGIDEYIPVKHMVNMMSFHKGHDPGSGATIITSVVIAPELGNRLSLPRLLENGVVIKKKDYNTDGGDDKGEMMLCNPEGGNLTAYRDTRERVWKVETLV